MFGNLIESGSHAADLKRKGRFFLGTIAFYCLLVVATGVGSIYASNHYTLSALYNPDGSLTASAALDGTIMATVLIDYSHEHA